MTNVREFLAYSATFKEFAIHNDLFPFSHHTMSLYIDMKMILPGSCSGSHFLSAIMFWISARICNVVNPGKIVHSKSIDSPSVQFSTLG